MPAVNPYDPPTYQEQPTKQPKGNFVPLLIGIPLALVAIWICIWGNLVPFTVQVYFMLVVPVWVVVWLVRRIMRKNFSLFWFIVLLISVVGSVLFWTYFMSTK
jgi:hypothetical protein